VEPLNDESPKAPEPRKEEKGRKRRFRLIRLEERIAPAQGGNGKHSIDCGPGGGNGTTPPSMSCLSIE
jgi:hypothetical protein